MIKNLTIIICLFLVFIPRGLSASESLRFNTVTSNKEKYLLSLIKDQQASDKTHHIAKTDLNDDFIDEYIIRPISCSKTKLCPHIIIGVYNQSPITLGVFDAHQIRVSFEKDYGIRRLVVYNQKNNDFSSRIAVWQPYKSQYILQ